MKMKIIEITDCDQLIKFIKPVHEYDFMDTPAFYSIGSWEEDEILIINFDDHSHSKSFFTHLDNEKIYKVEFLDCHFEKQLILNEGDCAKYYEKTNFTFINCEFTDLALNGFTYGGKIRFNKCKFLKFQNHYNVTFKNYVEFLECEFQNKLIFNKVEFRETVVFTKTKFLDNVLFTYTTFFGLGVFSRTFFDKGLDLSQAIINGSITFFEAQINNYHSEDISITDEKIYQSGKSQKRYDISVKYSGKIPTLNKRETFRIIKHQLEKQGNSIDAFKYNSLEKQAYQQQLKEQNKKWFNSQDALMFALNSLSNKHKSSWLRGVVFTVTAAILLYSLSIFSSGEFVLSLDDFYNTFNNNLKAIVVFLNPVHKPNYITEIFNINSSDLNGWYYALDFTGRIFIGYGIYQTVQAFRKFR